MPVAALYNSIVAQVFVNFFIDGLLHNLFHIHISMKERGQLWNSYLL